MKCTTCDGTGREFGEKSLDCQACEGFGSRLHTVGVRLDKVRELIEQAHKQLFEATGKAMNARIRPDAGPHGDILAWIHAAISEAEGAIVKLRSARARLLR